MSTRSNVIVQDNYGDRIQLYRHSDGYPDGQHGVLATLAEATEYAWPLPRFEASDFAAAIVRAWKDGGGKIYIDGSPESWELIHGDTEWVYAIKQAGGPQSRQVVVEVYDWHRYWLEKGDPDKDVPVPVQTMALDKATEVGLNWEQYAPEN